MLTMTDTEHSLLQNSIHAVPDYPKPGILFRDITGLLDDPAAYQLTIDLFAAKYKDSGFTKIIGTEARGFLFGAPLALALGISFIPVRKPGKLPRATISQSYQLEYGTDTLEIHQDALTADDKILIVDDLLATGGTIEATLTLAKKLGAEVTDAAFVISLPDLGGEKRLTDLGLSIYSLLQYNGD
ncbi:MAG: adenine phosphoribosyltransferase [Colwellia sp.]|jgi:adenine phosphoribosyltransferase